MVRRVASQVHKQVSRLAQSNYLRKKPVWYDAVLEHPPIPLPPRGTPTRTPYDLPGPSANHRVPHKPAKAHTPRIVYLEDDIRRQFFRDHPFEAFRERTLVESGVLDDVHAVRDEQWTRLRQRGRNPVPEECVTTLQLDSSLLIIFYSVVRFAMNLYTYHLHSLSDAYIAAVTQFRALRSEHHIATSVAVAEAEAYGAVFEPTETEKAFAEEEEQLRSWESNAASEQQSLEARKRWKAVIDKSGNEGSWTRGEEYVRLWKEGIRPNYMPFLTPTEQLDSTEKVEDASDPMQLRAKMEAMQQ